jgi:hypothetical protein
MAGFQMTAGYGQIARPNNAPQKYKNLAKSTQKDGREREATKEPEVLPVQMGRRVQGVVLADVFRRSSWHINWWRDPDPQVSQRWPWTHSVLAFMQYLGSGGAASREDALLPLELGGFYERWDSLTARLGYTSFNLPSTGLLGKCCLD